MALTPAERQRRYRLHKGGDHSLCDMARCGAGRVVADVTRDGDVTHPPPGLAARGRDLWRRYLAGGVPGPAAVVLLEEACRLADRLDQLHALLTGESDAWVRFTASRDGDEVTVTVDKALAEARLHATTLRAVVAELRQAQSSGGSPTRTRAPVGAAADPGLGVNPVDELGAARAARLAESAG